MSRESDAGLGLTSLIEVPGGGISLQTEVCLEPPRLRSIAVYRGRVIRRIDAPLELGPGAGLDVHVVAQHRNLERGVRDTLASLARSRAPAGDGTSPVALLFSMAVDAYAAGEPGTALLVLEALAALAPADERIALSLKRLRESTEDDIVRFA